MGKSLAMVFYLDFGPEGSMIENSWCLGVDIWRAQARPTLGASALRWF